MTPTRASILAALVAALGLTAMSPAFAAGPDHQRPGDNGRALEFRRDAAGGAFRFAEFSCGPNAADRLENRLDRMSGRLDLSSDQKKLFEEFRTSALTAQTDFADQCDTSRPGRTADADRSDLIERMEQRLKFDEARLAAMSELLPQFKTFYASLSDQQKRELMPRRGFMEGMRMPGKGLPHHQVPPVPQPLRATIWTADRKAACLTPSPKPRRPRRGFFLSSPPPSRGRPGGGRPYQSGPLSTRQCCRRHRPPLTVRVPPASPP